MKPDKSFTLECNGLDESLTFTYDENSRYPESNCFYLSHNIQTFYAYQQPVRDYFRRMFKMIWCALSGKEYRFFEIVILPEQLDDFKKFVAEL